MSHKWWSRKDTDKLIRLWNDGMPIEDIAPIFGRTVRSIVAKSKRLRELGVVMRRHAVGQRWTRKMDAELIALVNEGLPDKSIAKQMSISEVSVGSRASRLSKMGKMAITPPAIKRDEYGRVNFNVILSAVCAYHGAAPSKVIGKRRSNDAVRPRQVLMALVYRHTKLSYPQIAQRLNRDHTTVLHGVRAAEVKYPDAIAAIEAELFREAAE